VGGFGGDAVNAPFADVLKVVVTLVKGCVSNRHRSVLLDATVVARVIPAVVPTSSRAAARLAESAQACAESLAPSSVSRPGFVST
jgi:hypothetical protein